MNKVQQPTSNVAKLEQIDLPGGIINYLQNRTRMFSSSIKSRYWVSDIVSCQRKTYYKALGIDKEELLSDATLESMWDAARGDLLHKITYAYKWRELDTDHYIPLKDGRTAVLVGRLDMYDWRTKTIIDLKTTKFIKWQIKQGFIPRPEHILQVQCYDTVFSKTLQIENLNIVYADMSDIITYNIHRRNLTEWIRTRIQEIEDFIIGNKIPAGEVSGVCKYCRYQTRCYNDGNGLIDKPLSMPKIGSDSAPSLTLQLARDRFHTICKAALSADECVSFAAILDCYGKLIVGHSKNCKWDDEKEQSFVFYRDSMIPILPTMKGYHGNANYHKFQVINVGFNKKIAITQLRSTDVGIENKRCSYLLAVYCEYK